MAELIQDKDDLRSLPSEAGHYPVLARLPDGRICAICRFIYTVAILVDVHDYGYEDRYCYHDMDSAVEALKKWDGTGDPEGWHRHPSSGRRRDLETGLEWVAR